MGLSATGLSPTGLSATGLSVMGFRTPWGWKAALAVPIMGR